MTTLWQTPAVVVLILTWLASPPASLGEMAQREALRRATTPRSTATVMLTNLGQGQDAGPPAVVTLPPPAEPPTVAAPPVTPPTPPAGEGEDVKNEQWWRARVAGVRTAIDRGQTATDAFQSRINALQRDVVNLDDPARRTKAQNDLSKALSELERTNKQVAADRQALKDLQEEARRLNVPAGWTR